MRLRPFLCLLKMINPIVCYQICENEHSKTWQKVWLDAEKAWYMTSDDQWITYEDVDSAILKVIFLYN